jgi:hypothetical protein
MVRTGGGRGKSRVFGTICRNSNAVYPAEMGWTGRITVGHGAPRLFFVHVSVVVVVVTGVVVVLLLDVAVSDVEEVLVSGLPAAIS